MSKLSLKRETLCILDASNIQGGGFLVITKFNTCICPIPVTTTIHFPTTFPPTGTTTNPPTTWLQPTGQIHF
jgi:hypothetical protein